MVRLDAQGSAQRAATPQSDRPPRTKRQRTRFDLPSAADLYVDKLPGLRESSCRCEPEPELNARRCRLQHPTPACSCLPAIFPQRVRVRLLLSRARATHTCISCSRATSTSRNESGSSSGSTEDPGAAALTGRSSNSVRSGSTRTKRSASSKERLGTSTPTCSSVSNRVVRTSPTRLQLRLSARKLRSGSARRNGIFLRKSFSRHQTWPEPSSRPVLTFRSPA